MNGWSAPSVINRYTGKKMENWGLDDPTGQEDAVFVQVMEKIEEKIMELRERLKESART